MLVNLKILLIQETDWLKRGPHTQHHLLERLNLHGHEIVVLDFDILWKLRKEKNRITKKTVYVVKSLYYKGSKITLIRTPIVCYPIIDVLSNAIYQTYEIHNQISKFKPDIIIGMGLLNSIIGLVFSKIYKIPYIYYLIDTISELTPYPYLINFTKKVEQILLTYSDYTLTVNKRLQKYAKKIANKKIYLFENGIDFEHYNKLDYVKEISDKYNLSIEDNIIFYMGLLYNFSGLDIVIKEFINNKNAYNNFKIVIAGKGELYNRLKQIIKKYDKKNRVILTGYQNYKLIPSYISLSKICIIPSKNNKIMENIVPIKIIEYMGNSKPVISTRLPGVFEEFGLNNGVIFVDKPKDVIGECVNIVKKDLIKKHGKRAYTKSLEYDWNNISNKFEKFLIKVIKYKSR